MANKKISELEIATNVNEGCCLPIVSENETKKITYGGLKTKLNNDLSFVNDANYVHTDNNYTTAEKTKLAGIDMSSKQDVISDLASIRSGASAGATALQSVPSEYITETELNNYHDSTKQDVLVSGTNIKNINNQSLLGSGNIDISGGTTYTAGDGINITDNEISAKVGTGLFFNSNDEISLNNATQNTLAQVSTKQDTLVSGTNIKTINNESLLGSGNIDIQGGSASGDTLPIGAMLPYGKVAPPTNWLVCDGSAVSRTTYADLFNVIGTSYGAGDGSTTFNLPNKKGKVSVGLNTSDTDFDTIGETGGEKKHTLTVNEMPSHNHKMDWAGGPNPGASAITWGSESATQNVRTGNEGGGQAHNNLQPYQTDQWIIKAFQSSGVVANVAQTKTTSTTDVYSCNYVNNAIKPVIAQNRVNSQSYNINSGNYLPFMKEDYNNSNGKIVFNANGYATINHTGYIRVTLSVWFYGGTNQRPWIKFRNLTSGNEEAHCIGDIGSNAFITFNIPNVIVQVSSGDRIGAAIYTADNAPISVNSSSGNYASYMNIEIID